MCTARAGVGVGCLGGRAAVCGIVVLESFEAMPPNSLGNKLGGEQNQYTQAKSPGEHTVQSCPSVLRCRCAMVAWYGNFRSFGQSGIPRNAPARKFVLRPSIVGRRRRRELFLRTSTELTCIRRSCSCKVEVGPTATTYYRNSTRALHYEVRTQYFRSERFRGSHAKCCCPFGAAKCGQVGREQGR